MNIKNNIINYLFDKEFVIAIYDNSFYIHNYINFNTVGENLITVKVPKKEIKLTGSNLTIKKITKSEVLVNGNINKIEMMPTDEK